MKTLLLILILSASALACGAPSAIYGRVFGFTRSVVIIEDDFSERRTVTSPFGYYRFNDVTPCVTYRIRVENKWFSYPQVEFWLDEDIEINMEPMR